MLGLASAGCGTLKNNWLRQGVAGTAKRARATKNKGLSESNSPVPDALNEAENNTLANTAASSKDDEPIDTTTNITFLKNEEDAGTNKGKRKAGTVDAETEAKAIKKSKAVEKCVLARTPTPAKPPPPGIRFLAISYNINSLRSAVRWVGDDQTFGCFAVLRTVPHLILVLLLLLLLLFFFFVFVMVTTGVLALFVSFPSDEMYAIIVGNTTCYAMCPAITSLWTKWHCCQIIYSWWPYCTHFSEAVCDEYWNMFGHGNWTDFFLTSWFSQSSNYFESDSTNTHRKEKYLVMI